MSNDRAGLRTIVAGVVGNIMEWYDFALFGYFAPIIGKHFFPSSDPSTSLIASFGAFAAGFLMRPVGALIFGHVGDKIGRKPALTLSVLLMAIPTFIMGILPGHAVLGATAAVTLVILRMIQGVSVGGEYTTSIVFLVESAPPGRRGFIGSWSSFGAAAGVLLGSAAAALTASVLSEQALDSWGWRVPFIAGLGVGVVGLYIRRHLPEPKTHVMEESPVLRAFRLHARDMLKVFGLNLTNAVGFYLIFVYIATYLTEIVHIESATALDINTFSMVVLLVLLPLMGALSDVLGRRALLLAATVGIVLLGWPLFWLLHHHNTTLIILGQVGFTILMAIYYGALPATMAEAFPANVRCSALSITYNLCLGVVGGTTPLVATYLIERTGDELVPAYYIMAAAAVTLIVVLLLPHHALGHEATSAPEG